MTNFEFSEEKYQEYLQSDHWLEFSEKIKRERIVCEECGSSKPWLEVHHCNYDCLWHETDDDVILYCANCHEKLHIDIDKRQLTICHREMTKKGKTKKSLDEFLQMTMADRQLKKKIIYKYLPMFESIW